MSLFVRIQMLAVGAGATLLLMALAVVYGGLSETALLVSASGCALLLVVAGWGIARSMQGSLSRLEASIKQVEARRDLSVLIRAGQTDYAGIETAINHLLGTFRGIVIKVNQNTESLFESGAKISVASADMAAGSDQQHDSAGQITASITELGRSINKVAANAGQSRDISSETHTLCLEGEQRVQSTTGGVAHVAESFQSALHLVRSLEGSSDEIGGIIEVIGDIADQTNLLALNAAIEAARAGEQGRGFAVVADEVRGLAERTRVATLEVSRMVEGIRDQTSAVVATMESGREQVEQCVEQTSGTALILSQIIDKSGDVQQRADGISAEIDAQSRASDDLQQMAGSITETSRDNHDNIHKANDAVRQLLSEAIALNDTVREYSAKERNALNSIFDCIVGVRMNAVLVSNSETVAETMNPSTEVERLDRKIEQYWDQYRQASDTCAEEQRLAADYQTQWLAFKEARSITFARACAGKFADARANAVNNAGPKFRLAKAALIVLIDYHDKNKPSFY